MKNVVIWDVISCGFCKKIVFLSSMLWLLVTANIFNSLILVRNVSSLQELHGVTSQKIAFFRECCRLGFNAL
jgi:hypothetical protein